MLASWSSAPGSARLKDRLTVALQNEDIGTALRLVEQLDD
jgi:hypothetical protein